MKSIITTYLDSQIPAREVKIMMLATAGHAFDKPDRPRNEGREKVPAKTPCLQANDPTQIQSSQG